MSSNLIYFDNAATGYPKPLSVKRAVLNAFEKYGGNPGRSGHFLSVEASKAIYRCRESVCELLGFDAPERVVFTTNATHALNIAIKGLADYGDHIIISNLEHNSVYRPVYDLCKEENNKMDFSVFDATSPFDEIVINNFKSSIKPNTKIAVVTAASNVCGRILPLKEIGNICNKYGIKLIVDASQYLGHGEYKFYEIKAAAVCSAGHKGLYGPPGSGFAVFAEGVEPQPIIQGGNGLVSEMPLMGDTLPEMLEAGTLNTIGICGLEKGIKYISELGISKINELCYEIDDYISKKLYDMGVIVYSNYGNKVPIVLFNIPGASADAVSSYLDSQGICVRGGIHCSPLSHKALSTGSNGAVRASFGYSNTMNEARRFVTCIEEYCKNMERHFFE